ncbi:tigger transposable element-derived protein 3-like [Uloborus diversus]|uniref:tigger transposable element-derived protein 3-like n=1 Tax=Uloborus diversus TaxID=327109 RepID=UPI00240986BE|nr:tigger transposable element-derived protein 3-like [Uloborus diversus]
MSLSASSKSSDLNIVVKQEILPECDESLQSSSQRKAFAEQGISPFPKSSDSNVIVNQEILTKCDEFLQPSRQRDASAELGVSSPSKKRQLTTTEEQDVRRLYDEILQPKETTPKAGPSPSPKPRRDLSAIEKLEILRKYDEFLQPISQREASSKLGISQALLSRLLKSRKELQNSAQENGTRKRKREGKCAKVEEALLKWFSDATILKMSTNRKALLEKARELAQGFGISDFVPTDGWLSRWKERNCLTSKKGPPPSADETALDDSQYSTLNEQWPMVEQWRLTKPKMLLKTFKEDDIYFCAEMALYYRAFPDASFVLKSRSQQDDEQEDRITILATCNMTGTDRRQLLVIGKDENPSCFEGLSLPIAYKSNRNAWITKRIFAEFLGRWDRQLKMEEKKIALVLSDSHVHLNYATEMIHMKHFPSAMFYFLQTNIIKELKSRYRREMRQRIVRRASESCIHRDAGELAREIDLREAVHMLCKSWEELEASFVRSAFLEMGFGKFDEATSSMKSCDIDDELQLWNEIDEDVPTSAGPDDDPDAEESAAKVKKVEEDVKPTLAPTPSEVQEALSVLRRHLELTGGSREEFINLYKVQADAQRHLRLCEGKNSNTL